MNIRSLIGFLGRHKIFGAFCLALLFLVLTVITRMHLFLNNKCPGCGEALLFYNPKGYSDPVFEKRMSFNNTPISFSFSIDKYGDYYIRLEKINENKDSHHLSGNITYSLICESRREKVAGSTTLGYSKIFYEKDTLLTLDNLGDVEKDARIRRLISIYTIKILGSVRAFDIGSWSSGTDYDDIGRQYHCIITPSMNEGDFFEANLVVKRHQPH